MRSPEGWVLAAVLGLGMPPAGVAAEPAPPALGASTVRAAASAVAADPLLPGTETTRRLRLKRDTDPPKPARADDLGGWAKLLDQLATGLRVAIWLCGAGLLVWVLLRLRDWLGGRPGAAGLAALPPTHVGTLDIRPESLPADIGAAARALLARGEERAALSLLYRGALSRLVHGHGVPIRAASTERECLVLAAPRLAPASQAFLAELVAAWQAVAYAQRRLAPEQHEALCSGFGAQLAPPAPEGRA